MMPRVVQHINKPNETIFPHQRPPPPHQKYNHGPTAANSIIPRTPNNRLHFYWPISRLRYCFTMAGSTGAPRRRRRRDKGALPFISKTRNECREQTFLFPLSHDACVSLHQVGVKEVETGNCVQLTFLPSSLWPSGCTVRPTWQIQNSQSSGLSRMKQMARNDLRPVFDPCPISQTN